MWCSDKLLLGAAYAIALRRTARPTAKYNGGKWLSITSSHDSSSVCKECSVVAWSHACFFNECTQRRERMKCDSNGNTCTLQWGGGGQQMSTATSPTGQETAAQPLSLQDTLQTPLLGGLPVRKMNAAAMKN